MLGSGERAVQEKAALLREKIDAAVDLQNDSPTADRSDDFLRELLKRNQDDVDALFAALVQYLTPPKDVADDEYPLERRLRDAIRGERPEESRAKILATLLSADVQPSKDTWVRFMTSLCWGDGARIAPNFRDTQLPFSDFNIAAYFGSENAAEIAEQQHRFCPIDLQSHFEDVMTRLHDLIDDPDVLRVCRKLDRQGNEDMSGSEPVCFCAEGVVRTIIEENSDLIKSLHVEACKSHGPPESVKTLQEQRKFVEDAESEADKFYEGVRPRAKILAAIALARVQAQSQVWRVFSDVCFGKAGTSSPDYPELCDESLPLKLDVWAKYFPQRDAELMRFLQYYFCAAQLVRRKQERITSDQRLPLLEQQELGDGAFGVVYRVKIAAGHYSDREEEVAMKKMTMRPENEGEWQGAQWLFQNQPMKHRSIMRALASLITPEQIYIFSPLAKCNLLEYMTCEKGLPAGPDTFEARKDYFNRMIDVASALKFLHMGLEDTDRHDRVLCIHGDLKVDNILVSENEQNGLVFQITDFGISSIKHRPQDSGGWTNYDLNKLYSQQQRSLRDIKTRTILGSDCPNYAPEARLQDRQVDSSIDIWAFGTVLAEYIPWLWAGAEGVKRFERKRGGDKPRGADGYYLSFEVHPETGEPRVKESIWSWYDSLAAADHDDQHAKFYRACRELLEHHLLLCDPKKRPMIEGVLEILGSIHNSKDIDIVGMATERGPAELTREPPALSVSAPTKQATSHPNSGSGSPQPNSQPDSQSCSQPNTRSNFRPNSQLNPRLNSQSSSKLTLQPKSQSTSQPDTRANSRPISHLNLRPESHPDTPPDTPVDSQSPHKSITQSSNTHDRATRPPTPRSTPSSSPGLLGDQRSSANEPPLTDRNGRTPLLAALAAGNNTRAQELLSNGSRLDVTDKHGHTALHLAVHLENSGLVTKLVSTDPRLIDRVESKGFTALHVCARQSERASAVSHARILLDNGANPNIEDQAQRSVLWHATQHTPTSSRRRLVRLLLEGGAEVQQNRLGGQWESYPELRQAESRGQTPQRR